MRLPTLIAGAVFLAAPALADEVWDSNLGQISWLETDGADALLGVMGEGGGPMIHMVVPGLGADTGGGRGTYTGIWIASDGEYPCVTEMLRPDGSKSSYWGSFTITFLEDGFPSDFAGAYGDCLDAPSLPLQAHARVGR